MSVSWCWFPDLPLLATNQETGNHWWRGRAGKGREMLSGCWPAVNQRSNTRQLSSSSYLPGFLPGLTVPSGSSRLSPFQRSVTAVEEKGQDLANNYLWGPTAVKHLLGPKELLGNYRWLADGWLLLTSARSYQRLQTISSSISNWWKGNRFPVNISNTSHN